MMMKVNQRLLASFDWVWFFALIGLCAAGLMEIWSTTGGTGLNSYFGRQMLYLGIALVVFLILLYFDYHIFSDNIPLLYAAGILALTLVLIVGRTVHSNRSWLCVGGIAVQPSELVKILVIIAVARYFAESERDHLQLNELIIGALIAFVPMALVVFQGDLGTAITFVPIYVALAVLGGLRRRHILVFLIAGAIALPAGWMMLKDYQKSRIQTVLNPSTDPQKVGYQTIQSKIAVGSGRFLGKGFRQGSQGQLGFLPARHTDFVFSAWAEERGFAGSIALLGLFLVVCLRLLKGAREAKDRLGTMICVGVLALLWFHLTINVGMALGLMPVAGIPLPFVSAGGSSLISSFAAMGICMNIWMRRYVN
ncbi:MAG: rod shape-determining protein RodA [Acidobacteria bacterium]|nr:rod shape-determining protein RodA [Acidobacteriota bacterium]